MSERRWLLVVNIGNSHAPGRRGSQSAHGWVLSACRWGAGCPQGPGGGRNGGGGSRLLWDSLRPVLGDVQKADLAAGAKSPEPWGWAPGLEEPALLAGAPGIGL